MKNNKKLNEFYSKKFSKLYDVMTGIEKYIINLHRA